MSEKTEQSWVCALAPARIDLAGGWSDTPPITNDVGGEVTNIAVKVDGQKPIGAKICKIPKYELVLVILSKKTDDPKKLPRIVCKELKDLVDRNEPEAKGALLKAAFLCTEVVNSESEKTLADQLREEYNCGFELHTWSNLPQGSGMGTSSILAGAACAVIGRITGKNYSEKELIDLVLNVEKEMSTNGGWQDQVGGLIAGVKYTNSPAVKDEEPTVVYKQLTHFFQTIFQVGGSILGVNYTNSPAVKDEKPIRVYPKQLLVSDDKLNKLCSRMALIFTGKQRLAKNLLQDVIKRWEKGENKIKENVQELKRNANEGAEALMQGNITKLAECLNKYREQKLIMAPDSEPEEVRECYKILNKHECAGYCLVGAGGGGYLVVITKEGKTVEELRKLISPEYELNKIQIDNEGLVFTSHADWLEETKKLTQD